VVEALACGTPVVATPVGSVPELISDGGNGFVVPMKDPDALAVALESTLDRGWDRDAVSRSVMSWDQVAAKVDSVFRSIVESPSGDADGVACNEPSLSGTIPGVTGP
jgi:glycosyltransferase involved in cell wall biosynthesis